MPKIDSYPTCRHSGPLDRPTSTIGDSNLCPNWLEFVWCKCSLKDTGSSFRVYSFLSAHEGWDRLQHPHSPGNFYAAELAVIPDKQLWVFKYLHLDEHIITNTPDRLLLYSSSFSSSSGHAAGTGSS